MATMTELLRKKTRPDLISAEPEESVLQAAQRMVEYEIGSLLVMSHGDVVGMLTERDLMRRVLADDLRPAEVLVREVMTTDVACSHPDMPVDDARAIMTQHRVRHLPVISDEGNVLGLVSIGDLNAHQAGDREVEIQFLHEYLHGRV